MRVAEFMPMQQRRVESELENLFLNLRLLNLWQRSADREFGEVFPGVVVFMPVAHFAASALSKLLSRFVVYALATQNSLTRWYR